jgi:hypothetical protein
MLPFFVFPLLQANVLTLKPIRLGSGWIKPKEVTMGTKQIQDLVQWRAFMNMNFLKPGIPLLPD